MIDLLKELSFKDKDPLVVLNATIDVASLIEAFAERASLNII